MINLLTFVNWIPASSKKKSISHVFKNRYEFGSPNQAFPCAIFVIDFSRYVRWSQFRVNVLTTNCCADTNFIILIVIRISLITICNVNLIYCKPIPYKYVI